MGLWIDHRKAIIVIVTEEGEEIRLIESDMEKHIRYSGRSHSRTSDGPEGEEDKRDRQFASHLSRYYDEVISCIRDAESILILGPGEAKGELAKRLEGEALGERIVGIETVDKMTDRQIAAQVRQRFLK
jgi:stalled ribosome rescue protein Dom34